MHGKTSISWPIAAVLLCCVLAGCQTQQPVFYSGYDTMTAQLRKGNPGLSDYLRSLRPMLPDRRQRGYLSNPDIGQDYLALVVFGYAEVSLSSEDVAEGDLADALPAGQIRDGYPGYFLVEDETERWYQVPVYAVRYNDEGNPVYSAKSALAGHKVVREQRVLMSMEMPPSLLEPYGGYKHPRAIERAGMLQPMNGRLFGYRPAIEKRIGSFTHFVYADQGAWDACDVYILFGRLDGVSFARVFINPDLESLDAAIDGREIPAGWVDIHRELSLLDQVLRTTAEHQKDWPVHYDLDKAPWQHMQYDLIFETEK